MELRAVNIADHRTRCYRHTLLDIEMKNAPRRFGGNVHFGSLECALSIVWGAGTARYGKHRQDDI